ncbi:CBS domain-containing protein [Streptosporangium sp. NPDC004631]
MRVTVNDVMTRRVISVGENACLKEIAEALLSHAVSAVPVVDGENRVIGVVSEADLLRGEREARERPGPDRKPDTETDTGHAGGRGRGVARELMTVPAITVSMDAPVVIAGRLMADHGIKRLPVVDDRGRLVGVVSRRDLLKVFIRSDEDIEREVRLDVLTRSLWMDTSRVHVEVRNSVVTLSGRMSLRKDTEIAVWMTRKVSGVVDVIDKLVWDRDNTSL